MKKNKIRARAISSHQVEIGGHLGGIHILDEESPPYELRIDRNGRWFHEGVEIVREEIRNLFSRNLIRTENGDYSVRIGNDECPVIVEDVPLVIVRTKQGNDGDGLLLLINDGGEEELDARTIVFNDSNVPYCEVRGNMEARFSRQAYYQLAEFIEYEEEADRYWLVLNDDRVELNTGQDRG